MIERLLNGPITAERLGIKPRTLELWRKKNIGLPYVCVGRRRMYREVDVEAFIKRQRREVKATPDMMGIRSQLAAMSMKTR